MEKIEKSSSGRQRNEAPPSVSGAMGFSEVEDTSAELLKNTPSNIARLEDEIEHCKGREKYHAQTKSPSDGEDVRWYFCKVPLAEKQLSASVPQTEVVGKSDYFRFSMRDSLALEASFLQREEELLSYWWKEYAECSDGPSGPSSTNNDYGTNELYVVEEERVGVPVKGGLYEVDLTKRHCFPVYWHGENRRVLRGHWFARKGGLDWLPIREDVAEQLELAYRCQIWHRRMFQPSGLFAARVDLQGTVQGLHALFTGEDDTWEAWLVYDSSGFTLNVGRGHGIKVRRGFSSSGSLKPSQDELRQQKEEEMDDYCSQVPVGHLVFMVHGIGQRLEKANLVDDVGDFRRITSSLAERHLTPYQRGTQRVLFIPCQWRKALKLSGEKAVEKITLDGVRGLRVTLSATVHDVLYYMSPIYCQDIIDSVSNQLNRLYAKFLKRNPGYDGKVSIYGHSLGSVLSYDILCHQEHLSGPFPMESVLMECGRREPHVDATGRPLSSDAVISDDNNMAPSDSDSKQLLCASIEDSSMSHTHSNMEDIPETVKPISLADVQRDCAEDSSSLDGGGGSQPPLSVEQSSSPPLLEDANKGFGQLVSTTVCSEENKYNANSDAAAGNFESNVVASGIVTDKIIDGEKKIALLEEEVEYLRARIAELERKHILSNVYNGEGNRRNEALDCNERDSSISPKEEGARKIHTPTVKYTKLGFKVDTFYAAGSPLGVFLALRNVRIGIGRGQDYWQDEIISEEMPSCRQMFNIFHPFDPVAYRIEPLVCKEYLSKRPVIVPYHRGGKRLHIGFQEFREDISARSQAIATHLNSMKVKVVNVFKPKNKENSEGSVEDLQEEKERSYGSLMIERLTGSRDGRVDYVLQDKTFQHPYISALGAHTNYWRDYDTALFMLKHLYRDIPEEPDDLPSGEVSSQPHGRHITLYYDKDSLDEDLPLTFSDSQSIREFSRKARKARKAMSSPSL